MVTKDYSYLQEALAELDLLRMEILHLNKKIETLTDQNQDLKEELQRAKDFEKIATQAIEVLSVKR